MNYFIKWLVVFALLFTVSFIAIFHVIHYALNLAGVGILAVLVAFISVGGVKLFEMWKNRDINE